MDFVLKPHHNDDSVVIKSLKQNIIKTLLESETSRDVLNEDLILRIQNSVLSQITRNANTKPSQPDILVEDMA